VYVVEKYPPVNFKITSVVYSKKFPRNYTSQKSCETSHERKTKKPLKIPSGG
jgi:hypothetical protein